MAALGDEIRKRRVAFGLDEAAVARLARLPQDRLGGIENARIQPTTAELAAIADALASDPAMLIRGTADDPRRSVARFRGATTGKPLSPSDLRLLARAAEAGRLLASLRKLLDEGPSPILAFRDPNAPSPAMKPWRHGYDLGQRAREKLDTSRAPLPSVQKLFEDLGIHVADVTFENAEIEAASLHETGASPVILLNRRSARFGYLLARRAVLAHELSHLLHDGGERDLTVVSLETDQSPVEQRANGFAPNFIAPRPWVTLKSAEPREMAVALAAAWGLSFEGAAWHLKNLKRISGDEAERLKNLKQKPRIEPEIEFEQPLPRTPPEQFDIEAEPSELASGLLSETAIAAAAEGVITRGRAGEILSLR